jgi:hypothetical protein
MDLKTGKTEIGQFLIPKSFPAKWRILKTTNGALPTKCVRLFFDG